MSAEHRMALASALSRNGEPDEARRALVEADVYATFVREPELITEVQYYRASQAYVAQDYAAAETIAKAALSSNDESPFAASKLLCLLAMIKGLRSDPIGQIETLRLALDSLDRCTNRDIYLEAIILNNIAIPAAEINPPGVREFLTLRYDTIPWNDENSIWQFHILHQLAWLDALNGDHLSAFGRFRSASRIAPSFAWQALALAGRAYLAREMDERLTASECFSDASASIQKVTWSNSISSESVSLLMLASLAAKTDVEASAAFLKTFESAAVHIDPIRSAAHADPILAGLEAHAYGLVSIAGSERAKALMFLRKAYGLFVSVGSTWRAAVVALDIYDITHEDDMLVFAREQAARVPHSWLARRLSQTIPPPVLYKDVVA